MATNISEEEFLRLQNQLIELRTANYSLEEQYACQLSWSQQLQSQVEVLERECTKAHSSLNVMKRMKVADLMIQNERLQQKLQAQEDEFRLQNQTLLQELSSLAQENKRLCGTMDLNPSKEESSLETNEQVQKLLSEASALQRALSDERLRSAHEISKLKGILKTFINQMDEKLQVEVFGAGDLDLTPKSPGESDVSCSGDRGSDGTDTQEEFVKVEDELAAASCDDVKLVSTCRLTQLELADAMQETEKLREEKEKRESLENNLLELQLEYSNYKTMSKKKVEELEKSLQHLSAEQKKQLSDSERYKSCIGELENQLEHLKYKVNECGLENEVLHCKLTRSDKTIEDLNMQLGAMKLEDEEKVKSLAKLDEEMKGMTEEVRRLQWEKDMQVKALEQQIADLEEERSLRERKGTVVCLDLRRQLAVERKQVERLQERLREVLEGYHLKVGDKGLLPGSETSKVADGDATSISSWSLMSGNLEQQDSSTREGSLVTGSPVNVNGNVFPHQDLNLEQESRNLLERVASLQEEKWALEEKVNQLEQNSAAMSQDLRKKSEVIQFYCMDKRQEPVHGSNGKKGVKKLSDFLKTSEEEHLLECNARMQRMLEELLTKNMYLQRDMEQMSKEFEKLQHVEKNAE